MKFWSKKQSQKKSSIINYYDDIRVCPVYCWHKVQEYSNYAFLNPENLRIANPKNVPLDESPEGEYAFLNLLTLHMQEFGMSEHYIKMINLTVKARDLNLEFITTGERILKNEIRITEGKIAELKKKETKGADLKEEMARVASKSSRPFNDKEFSIFEYQMLANS